MKPTSIFSLLLLIGTLPTGAQQPATNPAQANISNTARNGYTNIDWQDPVALRNKLANRILAGIGNGDEKAVTSFLNSEANRLLLANWHLANAEISSEKAYSDYKAELEKKIANKKKEIENKEKELPELGGTAVESAQYFINKRRNEVAALEAELRQPMRLADVAKRPRGGRLISMISNDLGWLGDIVYTGECIMPGRMLNMLANMMERYPTMLPEQRTQRDIATATALEFARFGWTIDAACQRANYFVRNWTLNRLHAQFDTLPFWQRRVVCGWKGDHNSGTPESFTWALQHVKLPDDRYAGSCWRCGYILNNVYGELVHDSAYYDAFEGMYLNNHHQFTQDVGGVCGSLSHFGAAAACANGIPGLTMGEPGHCAFVVWVDGKWTPAYSVTWDRGLHWRPWMDNYNYSSLHLTTDLFSSAQKSATRISNAYRAIAQIQQSKGQTAKAIDSLLKAEKAQPLNYPVYRDHAELLRATKAGADAWMQFNQSLCSNMVPQYPECASTLARNFVYPDLAQTAPEQLETAFTQFWQNINARGPERWKIDELMDNQIALLNKQGKNSSTENSCSIFRSMITNTVSREEYTSTVLESGNNLLKKLDADGQSRILAIMTEAISTGENMSTENRTKALANAMLTAESMRDVSAFQAVSKMIDPAISHDNRPIGEFETFPGQLVSEGGMIFASSTSRWDKPATHASILTKNGGQVHTDRNNNPWVAVKLPKFATISGLVIAAHTNGSNWYRLNDLQVQVSATGKDDDWHNVGQPTGKCNQRFIRVDLSTELPKALYVRIIRPNVQDVFHIDGIFVYGSPAA